MKAVTIKSAKTHLNQLVQAAEDGGLELALELTDDQAARFWRELASEQASGKLTVFGSAEPAV